MDSTADDILFVCTSPDEAKQAEIYKRETKHQILSSTNDVFCKYYISKNVWMLRYFHQSLKTIEDCRNKDTAMEYWFRMLKLLQQFGTRKTDLTKLPVDKDVVERVTYLHTSDFEPLLHWKDKVHDSVFALLNYIYKNLYTAENVSLCLQCILHVSMLPKAEVFLEKSEYHFIDILWKVLADVAKECEGPVAEFYILCRDLYYYKLKQKTRIERLNYLLFCVLVMCKRDVQETVIDLGGDEKPVDKKPVGKDKSKGMEYLFVTIPVNEELRHQIEREKEYIRKQERVKKGVVVDKLPVYAEKPLIHVTKISF